MSPSRRIRWAAPGPVVAGALAAATACSDARPFDVGTPRCTTWKDDLAAPVKTACASCHEGQAASGGYDATSYLATLGPNSRRLASAGDPASLLLSTLDPATAIAPHAGFADLYERLRTWVVECDVAYERTGVHPGGILDPSPANADFHGRLVKDAAWSFKACQDCHGADFKGGKADRACTTCHTDGPTGCTTCHGAPPDTVAHRTHATGGDTSLPLDCTECHVKPTLYTDVGHLFTDTNGTVDPSPAAEVKLDGAGAKALLGATSPHRAGAPTFDPATRSCGNVYCHGDTLGDTSATLTKPVWDHDGDADCGKCHGLPPSNHVGQGACASCHGQVVDPQNHVVSRALHINGKVEVGGTVTGCTSCHGDPPATGAHAAHLAGARLKHPVACTECHLVPTDANTPGHIYLADGRIDGAPAELTFGSFAAARSDRFPGRPAPAWDHAAATCSNVYCHGGAFADSSATAPSPKWDGPATQADCGGCHGLPPASHAGSETWSCALCHGLVVDANRNIINPALHLDGHVSLGDGSGTCAACHGGTDGSPPPSFLGSSSTSDVAVGAHQTHLTAPHGLSGRIACRDCHAQPAKATDVGHLDSPAPAEVFPSPFTGLAAAGGATPAWNRSTATCSNVACHGGGKLANDASPGLNRTPVWTAVDQGQAVCGSCHGVPPQDGKHAAPMSLDACTVCHPQSIDATGRIIVTGGPGAETSTHVNGVVDVR